MIRRRSNNWIRPLMAIASTFSVVPNDFQLLSCVKFLSNVTSSSIDLNGGGVGKYPFNNATALRLWGCCSSSSNDSNTSCNNKYVNGFQRAHAFAPSLPLLLHDDAEGASTSNATKPSDTNSITSNRGSCAGFVNQDLHDKIVVAVDVDEGI